MPLNYHPPQGALVYARFDRSFRLPEMVKPRPCVILSKKMKGRPHLRTIVAMSTSRPEPVMPYHLEIDIPFEIPARWSRRAWVKGDMIYSASFDRLELPRLGRGESGRRIYQKEPLPRDVFRQIQRAVLRGLGIEDLTTLE